MPVVAAAPDPPPPLIEIAGATVYPHPVLVRRIADILPPKFPSQLIKSFVTEAIPTAVTSPLGAEENPIVG